MFRGRHPTLSAFGGGDLELPDPIELLTAAAVREMLARPDADTFLEWMRREGPVGHPGVFAAVPAPELWPSFATNLGIGLWNAMRFPDKGFRPDPLPTQKASAACRCRSGEKYGRCCARLSAPLSISPAYLWPVLVQELNDEKLIAAAASLQMPADLLLELAKYWQRLQLYELVLKLLEPVFRKLPKFLAAQPSGSRREKPIREVLEPLIHVFVDSLMERGGPAKERRWRRRLLAELPAELQHAVKVLGI